MPVYLNLQRNDKVSPPEQPQNEIVAFERCVRLFKNSSNSTWYKQENGTDTNIEDLIRYNSANGGSGEYDGSSDDNTLRYYPQFKVRGYSMNNTDTAGRGMTFNTFRGRVEDLRRVFGMDYATWIIRVDLIVHPRMADDIYLWG